jgi:hypothetical protein
MEYADKLPAQQSTRTLVASLVALVLGAAVATGVWAVADDDGSASAGGGSGSSPAAEDPGTQYGTSQYRLTNPPQPVDVPPARSPYGNHTRFAHP